MREFEPSDKNYWKTKISAQEDRLRAGNSWFPFPAFISFGLVVLFTGHLLIGLNPRTGSPANVLEYPAPNQHEGAIWMSVSIRGSKIVITTFDRKVFTLPRENIVDADLEQFDQYLKKAVRELTISTGLSKYLSDTRSRAILAVDQNLNYYHLRPIIRALGRAGMNQYGFETRLANRY